MGQLVGNFPKEASSSIKCFVQRALRLGKIPDFRIYGVLLLCRWIVTRLGASTLRDNYRSAPPGRLDQVKLRYSILYARILKRLVLVVNAPSEIQKIRRSCP